MSPPASSAALERALLRACSDVVRPKECAVAGPESAEPPAASVTWVSDETVDVAVRSSDGSPPLEKRIVFRPEDRDTDRWQAVGLVVASLVTRERAVPPASTDAERAPHPMKLPSPEPEPSVWIDIGALVGRGLERSAVRSGGWLRAGYRVARLPAFVSLGTSYAGSSASHGVSPEWATFSIGAGVPIDWSELRLLVRPALELAVDRVTARADGPTRGSTSGGRWVPATQGVVTVAWPDRGPVGLAIGGLAAFSTGATGVRVGGAQVSAFPALSYALLFGVDLRFPR